jgi:hypothetical protein
LHADTSPLSLGVSLSAAAEGEHIAPDAGISAPLAEATVRPVQIAVVKVSWVGDVDGGHETDPQVSSVTVPGQEPPMGPVQEQVHPVGAMTLVPPVAPASSVVQPASVQLDPFAIATGPCQPVGTRTHVSAPTQPTAVPVLLVVVEAPPDPDAVVVAPPDPEEVVVEPPAGWSLYSP